MPGIAESRLSTARQREDVLSGMLIRTPSVAEKDECGSCRRWKYISSRTSYGRTERRRELDWEIGVRLISSLRSEGAMTAADLRRAFGMSIDLRPALRDVVCGRSGMAMVREDWRRVGGGVGW
jgi:hypothetical protein